MANWYGTARTNYFRVKDANVFHRWTERRRLEVFKSDKDADVVAIHPSEDSDGAWPSYDLEENAEFDLATELAEHLVPGQVAVLLEVGAEKLRYLTGQAIAVNVKGGVVELTLSDIYRKAARAFRVSESEITRAEY
jgi:hypothetical protein